MKKLMLITFLFFQICSCNENSVNEEKKVSDVVSGITEHMTGLGYDFSEKKIIWYTATNFLQTVDLIDLHISAEAVAVPIGEPPKPIEFRIFSSPIGYEIDTLGIIARGMSPDSTKSSIQMLSENNIDNIKSVPSSGYILEENRLNLNSVYALQTQDNKYAIVQFTEIDTLSDTTNYSFRWRYQPNGSTSFE